MFKKFIQKRLEKLVQKYLQKHKPVLVLVVGSVGKTSAKMAIATVLAERFRVRTHEGNHNMHMSAPLAILGIEYPGKIRSVGAWLKVFQAARLRIKGEKDVDVIVQELGTDMPGDIAHFGTYLQADIAVVTAVSNEHMEFFKTIEAVAREEFSVASFSKLLAVNRDDISGEYASMVTTANVSTYGLSGAAEYRLLIEDSNFETGFTGKLITQEVGEINVNLKVVGEHNTKAAVAAGLVAAKLGLTAEEIKGGIAKIRPVKGRMNVLRGQNNTILIDDSYNSSAIAAVAALQTIYKIQAPQRIAILGSINEMGELSQQEHEKVGNMCDPNALAWVVTVGEQAKRYLAPAAVRRGCQVRSFISPYDAGAFVHSVMEKGAVILAKGSQNGVFTEEAIKILLHSTDDEANLVRQSPAWLAIKQRQFSKF
ncbi:MAG TPA: Mur ligase family protein [Verrucomicrobiae bacterium]|nr:Mur ligase family protein [Verrucomicrobiae bacterium]